MLVDDGSTDRSSEICDQYAIKDPRIKVFHKENGGVSSARNVGLDNATGEWITFCDSDDFVYANWLENFVDNISEGIDLICQAFECDKTLVETFKDKRIFGLIYKGSVQDGLLLLDEKKLLGYLWIKLFKRSIIESYKLRFNVQFNYWEDQEFCFRYFSCIKNIICTDDVGYYYFIPNWGSKYSKKNNMFYLYQSLYKSTIKIYDGKINIFNIYFLDSWLEFLLSLYKDHYPSTRKYLHVLRKQVGKNIMKSHLFFFTKLSIYLDVTTYISNFVLKLHVKFKY